MLTIPDAAARLETSETTLRRRLREAFPDRRRGARIDEADLPALGRALGLTLDLSAREPRS